MRVLSDDSYIGGCCTLDLVLDFGYPSLEYMTHAFSILYSYMLI